MCVVRISFCTWTLWHVAHSAISSVALSCAVFDTGLWTEWHVVQPMFLASCWLPAQKVCPLRLWHVTHVALTSRGDIVGNFLMCPLASSSTCALPGPWHDSQPCCAAGVRGSLVTPWRVPLSD